MTDPVLLLSQLHGEGRVTFRALRAAGFYTITAIAETPGQTLADRAHLSARTARRLKTGAEELIGKGVGLETPGSVPTPPARRRRRPGSETKFSEGVLLEEAALLGQGQPGQSPDATEPSASGSNGPSMPPHAAEREVAGRIAAAAEAAAALSRPATVLANGRERHPAEPSRLRGTFWGFG